MGHSAKKRHKSLDTYIEWLKFKWIPEFSKHTQQPWDRAKPDLQPFYSLSEWMAQVLTTEVPKLSEHAFASNNKHQTRPMQNKIPFKYS